MKNWPAFNKVYVHLFPGRQAARRAAPSASNGLALGALLELECHGLRGQEDSSPSAVESAPTWADLPAGCLCGDVLVVATSAQPLPRRHLCSCLDCRIAVATLIYAFATSPAACVSDEGETRTTLGVRFLRSLRLVRLRPQRDEVDVSLGARRVRISWYDATNSATIRREWLRPSRTRRYDRDRERSAASSRRSAAAASHCPGMRLSL